MAPIDYNEVLKRAGIDSLHVDDNVPDDILRLTPAFRAVDGANALVSQASALDAGTIAALLRTLGINLPAPAPTTAPAPAAASSGIMQLITMLFPFLIALFQKKLQPAPAQPPAPAPPVIPGVPAPDPVPGPAARVIAGFRFAYFQLVRDNKTVPLEGEDGWRAVLGRTAPVVEGDRVVTNASPYDQFGSEIRDGQWTKELEAAMFFSNGTHRTRYYGNNREVSHITMNHPLGLQPRIKVDRGALPNDVDVELGELYGLYYTTGEAPVDDEPDFSRPSIKLPTLHSLRARK